MIDKQSGIPYYRQLMDLLQTQIDSGALKEGQQIATELEMSEVYRVNRHTVRQAVTELCKLGILYKLRGRGTFVAKSPLDAIEYKLSSKNRFTENIFQIGHIPKSKILRLVEIVPNAAVRNVLQLASVENVFFLEILRYVDENPFLTSQVYLPVQHFPGLLEFNEEFHSLTQIYDNYRIAPRRVMTTVRATFPSQEEAMMLGIPVNMPVLKAENLLKSQDDILIAYNVSCYRGNLAKININW